MKARIYVMGRQKENEEMESIKLAFMEGNLEEIKSRGSVSRSHRMTGGRCQVVGCFNIVQFIFWGEHP